MVDEVTHAGERLAARDVVTQRTVRRVEQFPHLDLAALDTSGLEARDAALANAIDHAVARRWLTLRTVIQSQLSRPWEETEATLRAVLLVGAAQMLFMDRLPDHAVINEAVEWAKRNIRVGAGGMVNAVLRKVAGLRGGRVAESKVKRRDELPLSDGGVWVLNEEVFARDATERLAEQTSHPVEVIEHWEKQLGREGARVLAMHNLVVPPVIVGGLEGGDAPPQGFAAHEQRGFFVSENERVDLEGLFAMHANALVQDPGTAAACELTRGLSFGLMVDACAGRGTKTKQLAAMHPTARIVATDADGARLRDLYVAFAQSEHVRVVAFEELEKFVMAKGGADLVVLDVPCSNTGVLARRVEAKYRLSRVSIEQLVELQRRIVDGAVGLLKRRGHVLYATCSLEPAENGEQVEWMERKHGLKRIAAESRFPRGLPGDAVTRYADGGYGCLLGR